MADELDRLAASFQQPGGDGDGGAYLAQLARALIPGDKDPTQHLLAMARLSPKKAQAVAILLNSHYRVTKPPRKLPKGVLDFWNMSDGPRIALLVSLISIAHGGAGRGELVSVLGGITKMVKSRASGMFSRDRGRPEED